MKKLLLNHPALKGLLMLLTILFAMPQAALAQTYKLEGNYVKFSKFVQPDPEEAGQYVDVTEAAAGDQILVYIDYDANFPKNYYPTGDFSSDQVTVTKIYDEDGSYRGSGQFVMLAQDVTVNAVVAAQEEYVIDLTTATSQVIPESMWILLYSLDNGNEDPESPQYNIHDETGNRYLDLNKNGTNDLQVIEIATSGASTYKIVRLDGADELSNCRFALSYVYPMQYNSVLFKFPPHALQADWVTLSSTEFTYDGTAKEPTVTVMDGDTPVAVTVTYSNNTDAAESTAEKAPTVTVTANAEGYTGSVVKTFTITPKPVTVKADKKKKYAHTEDPELTATVVGIVDADKQKANIIAYTLSRAEGEKTGTYDITPSGDAEQGNYSVSYEAAKLYILHAPSPFGVWVNEIAVTADNRLDILGDADETNKKAPSVQYFEDGNVLVLTNATVETIESEGDLEVYMAPESQNTVGSITRGINDPEDPDENVAQSRSLGWEAPVVGGKTTFQNRGMLHITSDLNFYGKMNFPHLTGQINIIGYSVVLTGGRLKLFNAAGKAIVASASVSTPQEIAAVRADATPVTRKTAVAASAIAGAVTDAGAAKGDDVTVTWGLSGGFSESGAAKTNFAVVTGGMADPGLGTATGNIVAPSGAIHMQNYGQEGGDAVKTNENGETAVSLKSESGLSEVYRLYNPNSGEHIYTKNPQERDALCSGGWQSEGSSFQGELISGAELELSAGKGNFSVDCHEASTQLVVAIKPVIEVQEPLRRYPQKFYTGASRGINAQIGNTKGRSVQTFTYNLSSPARVFIFKESANVTKSRSANNDEEESELLIYGIDINPEKVYACNSIAEVTGGEYVGLEYIQEELPGQKVTGDDADLPKPGDVNGDDEVNAVDIVMTIDHINGGFSATFCKSAANLKADDTIDQADVDEMVKLILKQK